MLFTLERILEAAEDITAFTVAHSITLACAVLGIFPVPGPPIEVLIALSILMLAREVVMSQRGQINLVTESPGLSPLCSACFTDLDLPVRSARSD